MVTPYQGSPLGPSLASLSPNYGKEQKKEGTGGSSNGDSFQEPLPSGKSVILPVVQQVAACLQRVGEMKRLLSSPGTTQLLFLIRNPHHPLLFCTITSCIRKSFVFTDGFILLGRDRVVLMWTWLSFKGRSYSSLAEIA